MSMKHKMTEEDLDHLQVIKDFDFDSADRDEYRDFLRSVMHFVGYRVMTEMLPPERACGERRCPTCKHEIILPHRYCQFCGQRIVNTQKEAANKKAAQVAKEAAAKRKEARENGDDRPGYMDGLQDGQRSEETD